MKRIMNYTDEAQALIKEKMAQGGVIIDYEIMWSILNELGEEIEKIEELKQGYDEKTVEIDGAEYLILTDEEAEEKAREILEEFLEEEGVGVVNLDLEYYYDSRTLEDLAGEVLEAFIINTVEDLDEEELKEEMEIWGASSKEELIEKKIDDRDPEEVLREIYTDEELVEVMIEAGGIDIERLIDDIIWIDGRGLILSDYDSAEIEIPVRDDELYYIYRIR